MEIDRRAFFASLGGAAAVALMSDEAKADALEHYLMAQAGVATASRFPTVAEIEAEIETRANRKGVGNRYHQALRFYEDKDHGYRYPDLYRRMFGSDYTPEPYVEQAWQKARKHKWYFESRMVTVNDLYAFEPNVNPTLEQFTDIIGRQFRQPKEGLGYDNSPVAHMWRSMAMPDHPL